MSLGMPGENTEDIDVPLILRHKIHIEGALGVLQLLNENADRHLTGDQSYVQDQLPPKDYAPALEFLAKSVIETMP